MAKILGIGIATLDIINTVEGYPAEDAEVRALEQQVRRGGNCTNTLVILSQQGHECSWGGVLVDEPDAERIVADLRDHGIDLGAARTLLHGKVPTSYIVLNRHNGSRTIIHYRDLPEFSYEDFQRIDLRGYDWLHVEGRNTEGTLHMLVSARERRPDLPISVEIEKPRPAIERLFPHADLLLYSRHYASACGHDEPQAFLRAMHAIAPAADLIAAWGEHGAYGLTRGGAPLHSPAFPPPRIVDTLGAGDTFNAGLIDALLRSASLDQALHAACHLAGYKCGVTGLIIAGYHIESTRGTATHD